MIKIHFEFYVGASARLQTKHLTHLHRRRHRLVLEVGYQAFFALLAAIALKGAFA
jgi:hypothetical protein